MNRIVVVTGGVAINKELLLAAVQENREIVIVEHHPLLSEGQTFVLQPPKHLDLLDRVDRAMAQSRRDGWKPRKRFWG